MDGRWDGVFRGDERREKISGKGDLQARREERPVRRWKGVAVWQRGLPSKGLPNRAEILAGNFIGLLPLRLPRLFPAFNSRAAFALLTFCDFSEDFSYPAKRESARAGSADWLGPRRRAILLGDGAAQPAKTASVGASRKPVSAPACARDFKGRPLSANHRQRAGQPVGMACSKSQISVN
jgi:hypothetical protein